MWTPGVMLKYGEDIDEKMEEYITHLLDDKPKKRRPQKDLLNERREKRALLKSNK